MKTMDWPPRLKNGRLQMVTGAEATRVLVMQTLGDLQQNPFNPDDISLGDVTFRVNGIIRARISNVLKRMAKLITIQAITESSDQEGKKVIMIDFIDRETRTQGRTTVDG
jgi:hypothetical protein